MQTYYVLRIREERIRRIIWFLVDLDIVLDGRLARITEASCFTGSDDCFDGEIVFVEPRFIHGCLFELTTHEDSF